MLPGGTKLATHDLTATAISAARVAPIISHRREGGKRNLEDAHHRFPSEGDSFHRKTFRHFPEKFSPFSTYHHRVYHSHCMRVEGSLGRYSPLGRLQLLWPYTLDA